ncbi:MAG: hypothetical protein ACRDI2_15500 [Chloroflexota bacterium]
MEAQQQDAQQQDAIPEMVMAYHEAGHAVIAHLYGGAIHRVSIVPTLGSTPERPTTSAVSPDAPARAGVGRHASAVDQTRQQLSAILAGEAADALRSGQAHPVSTSDRDLARTLALDLAGGDASKADAIVEAELTRTRDLLQRPDTWARVEAIAQALLRHRTLEGERLQALLAGSEE